MIVNAYSSPHALVAAPAPTIMSNPSAIDTINGSVTVDSDSSVEVILLEEVGRENKPVQNRL